MRAYERLEHGEHLRAWVYAIAGRVALDELRRRRPCTAPPGWVEAEDDERPAFAEGEHLTSSLPPTEQAAVVLRYGYDLDYAQIADALGSTPEAARQAASSGVRRLRKEHA